jgi:hypothetical protein
MCVAKDADAIAGIDAVGMVVCRPAVEGGRALCEHGSLGMRPLEIRHDRATKRLPMSAGSGILAIHLGGRSFAHTGTGKATDAAIHPRRGGGARMMHGRTWLSAVTILAASLAIGGCCGGGKSSDSGSSPAEKAEGSTKAMVGEAFKAPGSDFSVTVLKAAVTDQIGDTKPNAAGQKFVIVYYKIKNEGTEPKSHLLAFDEKLKDKTGATYETSADGALALALAEPEASKGTLDKIAVGAEIPHVAVYAVPADKATGELEVVFSELISLGTPKSVSVTITPSPKKFAGGDAPAGSGAKPAQPE